MIKHKFHLRFYKNVFNLKPFFFKSSLLWKDKWNTPRVELEPCFRFEWLWFGVFGEWGEGCQYWEQWLWIEKYHDGDIDKAKSKWGWTDCITKESTWKDYGYKNQKEEKIEKSN